MQSTKLMGLNSLNSLEFKNFTNLPEWYNSNLYPYFSSTSVFFFFSSFFFKSEPWQRILTRWYQSRDQLSPLPGVASYTRSKGKAAVIEAHHEGYRVETHRIHGRSTRNETWVPGSVWLPSRANMRSSAALVEVESDGAVNNRSNRTTRKSATSLHTRGVKTRWNATPQDANLNSPNGSHVRAEGEFAAVFHTWGISKRNMGFRGPPDI